MTRRVGGMLGALLLLGACGGGAASGGATSGAGASRTAAAPAPARGTSNLIVEAEVAAAGVTNALEAVQRLRPSMLRGRGGASPSDQSGSESVMVYVDGVRVGGTEQLSNVTALSIREIRFISAADATTRFGTGHPMGAILVVTKR